MWNWRRSTGAWLLLVCSLVAWMAAYLNRIQEYLQPLIFPFPAQDLRAVGHPASSTRLSRNGSFAGGVPAARKQPIAGDEPLKSFKQPNNNLKPSPSKTATALRRPSNDKEAVGSSVSVVAPRPVVSRDGGTVYYSVARTDRSGSAIHDMLLALAYAHSKGAKYGGACNSSNPLMAQLEEQKNLIRELGLQGALKFACPKNSRTDRVALRRVYSSLRGKLLSPEFLQWLWSTQVKIPNGADRGGSGSDGAVVHIRRGDVSPCGQWSMRYLPNSHYAEVLKRHVPSGVPVTIFSESYSPIEPWEGATEFVNYTLRLDTDVTEVWRAISSARYIVLSRSSFSYTPALLNPHNATVLYTRPFGKPKLPGWVAVGDDLVRRSKARVQLLSRTMCGFPSHSNVTADYWNWRHRERNDTLAKNNGLAL